MTEKNENISEPVTPVAEPVLVAPVAETPVTETTAEVVEPTTPEPAPEPVIETVETPAAPVAPVDDKHKSMRQRMAEAADEAELDWLIAEGDSDKYRFASSKTRNRWRAAARDRRAELKG